MSNKKVFKLQNLKTAENSTTIINKRHAFNADMSTRKLYSGLHKVEIQVNGSILAFFEFELLV